MFHASQTACRRENLDGSGSEIPRFVSARLFVRTQWYIGRKNEAHHMWVDLIPHRDLNVYFVDSADFSAVLEKFRCYSSITHHRAVPMFKFPPIRPSAGKITLRDSVFNSARKFGYGDVVQWTPHRARVQEIARMNRHNYRAST
tara:strand:- start:188 stop:619 length:432 start_codon:yes stop_codon:yes gene_type:complete